MKRSFVLSLCIFALFGVRAENEVLNEQPALEMKAVSPLPHYNLIAARLAKMLPRNHVLQKEIDDSISQIAWTNLVSFYDFDRSIFLKSDLNDLSAHERLIDDDLKRGDVSFGYKVFALYRERLAERITFVTNVLANTKFDFTTNETYKVKRKTAEWPETKEDAEAHWLRRLKYELLAQQVNRELDDEEKLARKNKKELEGEEKTAEEEKQEEAFETPKLTPGENLIKKYCQYLRVMAEADEELVLQNYLSAICRAYDPHTDYFSPTTKEDFDVEMNLSLCGVGALLTMDDGALKIAEVMPGGPIARDGRLKSGDKIVGVAQGTNEFEDIMWQPMKKSIRKIRGPKGTRVTLEVIPRSDLSGAIRKRYELIRDEIKLEDQAATGRVERVVLNGVTNKVGYVYLPSFYGTMDKKPGEEGFRSCAEDVANYISQFNAQDVDGLILDLRDNGGGSLLEAVRLSALFVPSGSVVQIRDTRRVQQLPIPPGNPVAFTKPVIVMINRASASASEIVAAHLRDTARAIVVGDVRSHGKGTVQTVLGMGNELCGSLKVTTARFYRVDGRSTQIEGIASDIYLPSLLDSLDIGEDKLDNALPFSKIGKAGVGKCWNLDTYIDALSEKSTTRLVANERYKKHLENVAGMKGISDREEVPLEYEAFKAMAKNDRSLREFETLDDDEDEESIRRRKRNQRKEDDVVLDETFLIMNDLIELTAFEQMPKPPPTMLDWYNAILGM